MLLKALGLKICVERKRWYLGTKDCGKKLTRTNFQLSGTIWDRFEKKEKEVKYVPQSLSHKDNDLRIIWDALCERYPYMINAQALAEMLGKGNTEKQISNQIDRLKRHHLKDEKWRIRDNNTREYAIIPK